MVTLEQPLKKWRDTANKPVMKIKCNAQIHSANPTKAGKEKKEQELARTNRKQIKRLETNLTNNYIKCKQSKTLQWIGRNYQTSKTQL